MNLRDKAFENAKNLSERALAFASGAINTVREHAPLNPAARHRLEASLTALKSAGRELRKVAGLHASKFVEQNSTLVRAAGKDVSALARSTYRQFTHDDAGLKPRKAKGARKVAATRKRVARQGRAVKVA